MPDYSGLKKLELLAELYIKDARIAEYESRLQATTKRAKFLQMENESLHNQVKELIDKVLSHECSSASVPSQE